MRIYYSAKSYVVEQGQIAKRKALISMRRNLLVIKRGLAIETQETKTMLYVYHQYTLGKASQEDMRSANRQFGNVIKGLGLGVVVILPFSPITIPAIVKLGEKFGVNVLPSSFDFSDDVSQEQSPESVTRYDDDQLLSRDLEEVDKK